MKSVIETNIIQVFLFFFLAPFVAVFAQNGSALQLTGRWSEGQCEDVAAEGTLSYYSNGATLEIVDFTTPSTPQKISSITLENAILGIAVRNGLIYVVGEDGFFNVIDATDPALPQLVSYLDLAGSEAVELDGNYAFVSGGNFGIYIIDISSPDHPQIISQQLASDFVHSICVSGNYAYLGTDKGADILNISNKNAPFLVHEITLGQIVRGTDYHNGLLFLAAINMGLVIYDVSDPNEPVQLSVYNEGGNAEDVQYRDGYLFVANRYPGMYILDISSPANPVQIGKVDTQRAAGIFVLQHIAYIADTWAMSVVDFSTLSAPEVVAVMDVGDILNGLSIRENHLYLANGGEGMTVLDVTNSAMPMVNSHYMHSKEASDVQVRDTVSFIADGSQGLLVVSVADVTNPYLLSSIAFEDAAYRLDIRDQYAYVCIYDKTIAIVDISDLLNPVLVDTIHLPVQPEEMVVTEDLLIVCGGNAGLWIYDRTNPVSPVQLSVFEHNSWIMDAMVRGNTLYLAEGGNGLTLLDISNPGNPVIITSFDLPDFSNQVIIEGGFAYVATQYEGLHVLDISNSNAIHEVAFKPAGHKLIDMALAMDNIYLLDEAGGVFILHFDSTAVATFEPPSFKNTKALINARISPNPFSREVAVTIYLEEPATVQLAVYNAKGLLVHTLPTNHYPAGEHKVIWNIPKGILTPGNYVLQASDGKSQQAIGLIYIE